MGPTTILLAGWVAPFDQPLIRDGAVAIVDGLVADVGSARQVRPRHPSATVHDFGSSLLMPGFVNPHVHLEMSDCECGPSPGGSFTHWITTVRQRMRVGQREMADVVTSAVRSGVGQCLRFGVTTAGDISSHFALTRPLLREGPLRVVSHGEILGLARSLPRAQAALEAAPDRTHESTFLRIGITPHAPYTVDMNIYRRCVQLAEQAYLPLATHLAETPDEREFLMHQHGPFRDVWESLGQWEEPVPTYRAGGPIEFARDIGLLDAGALLAHVNYCSDAEIETLARGNASIVYCPRTHRYFDRPPHRWREMLARGINVAVGTDSCASSPDLNILADLRVLRTLAPDFPADELFRLITSRAARALHLHEQVGTLAPGRSADLVRFEIPPTTSDPLEDLLRNDVEPSDVWIRGQRVGSSSPPP